MDKKEFTFYDLIEVLKKHWLIILISAIILGALFGVYAQRTYHEQYSASVTFYVSPSQSDQTADDSTWSMSTDAQKLSWALKVINSYVEILNSNRFAEKVDAYLLQSLGEETYNSYGLSQSVVKKSISFSIHDDANLFTTNISTSSAASAKAIADAVEQMAPEHISEITKAPDTVTKSDSTAPYVSNSKNLTRNILIGVVLGALISYIVFFIIELLDVRVKNEDNLISNYDVPLLGTIPDYTSDMKTTRQGY